MFLAMDLVNLYSRVLVSSQSKLRAQGLPVIIMGANLYLMMLAPQEFLGARASRVREFLEEIDIDVLIVTHLPNIFYLTNFSGSAGIVVLSRTNIYLITDFRYVSVAGTLLKSEFACPGARLVAVVGSYDATLAKVIEGFGPVRVGFESDHLSVKRYQWLDSVISKNAGVQFIPTDRLGERARIRKDAYEISVFRKAARLMSEVVPEVLNRVRIGCSENEIAVKVDSVIREIGFDRPAFDTIVASGPNSSLPHAQPGQRKLSKGDTVVLDFGGVYEGYCLDVTRMISLGEPSLEIRELYKAVRQAQAAGLASIREGVLASQVDASAREVLDSYSLADAFGHGTGHGLGIEIHEAPRIAARSEGKAASVDCDPVLETGMVFTVEPGVYLSGKVGVRLEDDVLVVPGGYETLTEPANEMSVHD